MQNTPLKLNSFCFRCQEFKRHDWRHLAHFSCSSATAGMHVARIQNCPEAHPEQLRIKDCFQNTKFILFLSFRVPRFTFGRLLNPSLCSFSTLQCFPHPALSGHLQVSLVPFRTPAACRTLCQNLIHFVSGVQCSRDMIGSIWHTSRAALPLLACMLQGFKIVRKPMQSS